METQIALTFDDVSVVPGYSDVLPSEVDVSVQLTPRIKLNIPIVSAAMDTVTESKMAIALAQLGGLGVIHKNLGIDEQAQEVLAVKKFDGGIVKDPYIVYSYWTLSQVKELSAKTGFASFPVVIDYSKYNSNKKILIGMITARDIKFQTDKDINVHHIMTPVSKLVLATEETTMDEIKGMMFKFKVEKIPVVRYEDGAPILIGLATLKDMEIVETFPDAVRDSNGKLIVAAAVGVSDNAQDRVKALVDAGVDALVVDSAHGHSRGVIVLVNWIAANYPQVDIIAGNIVTRRAYRSLWQAGANCVKVGIGPGSICTTRVVAGVGIPQFTAIQTAATADDDDFKFDPPHRDMTIISDGGIRYSGDILKAMVAGADAVMLGGLLAGTDEAPGETELYQGRTYKNYRGMGSIGAMSGRYGSSERYFQGGVTKDKLVPEGIEGRVPYRGPVRTVIHQLIGGLKSGMGYIGARSIAEIHPRGAYVVVSPAGQRESHPHDISITQNAPNYTGEGCL